MKYFRSFSLLFFILDSLFLIPANAQESLSLSLTPPLYQIAVTPGQEWATTLKVINANPYDLVVYVTLADFRSEGEAGQAQFIPLASGSDNLDSLARWIDITKDAIRIPPNQSAVIPFSLRVPANASPGGHYAAILVGTQPNSGNESGAQLSVASMITSLIFARVEGDVVESGNIREFSTVKSVYQTPNVEFSLRFENGGNVHVTPQGDISIFDMWGRQRASIPINHKAGFGSVLPDSTRKFVFKWEGGDSMLEMGRYEAIATVTFGSEARQNASRTLYFWVIPFKLVGSVLAILVILAILLTWFIKSYIRKALTVHGLTANHNQAVVRAPANPLDPQAKAKKEEVMDLRNR